MKRDGNKSPSGLPSHVGNSQLEKGVHVARPMRAPHTKPPTGPPGQKRLDAVYDVHMCVCVCIKQGRRSTEIETYSVKNPSYWRWDTYHEDKKWQRCNWTISFWNGKQHKKTCKKPCLPAIQVEHVWVFSWKRSTSILGHPKKNTRSSLESYLFPHKKGKKQKRFIHIVGP